MPFNKSTVAALFGMPASSDEDSLIARITSFNLIATEAFKATGVAADASADTVVAALGGVKTLVSTLTDENARLKAEIAAAPAPAPAPVEMPTEEAPLPSFKEGATVTVNGKPETVKAVMGPEYCYDMESGLCAPESRCKPMSTETAQAAMPWLKPLVAVAGMTLTDHEIVMQASADFPGFMAMVTEATAKRGQAQQAPAPAPAAPTPAVLPESQRQNARQLMQSTGGKAESGISDKFASEQEQLTRSVQARIKAYSGVRV